MQLDARLRRRDAVLTQRASETVVLLDADSGEYYALDDVAGRLWDLCDGTRSVQDIVQILCQEYDAPSATIEADIVDMLGELTRERLLIASDSAA
ncbi:MAG: PqqD family protein [Gemmatimonadota bacterium]|nr:PqqD family protein [Gemmatimonadota bacterium]